MLDMVANDTLVTSESFALGVAVGLGLDISRAGRAYILTDPQADRVRDRIKAHYRRHPGKSRKRLARAS